MKQPLLAPAAVGGSVFAGVTAMLIGGYRIVDCFRFETGRGACDEAVDSNTPAVLAGAAAVAGSWGGLFTYNRKLERPGGPTMVQALPPWRRPEDNPEPATAEVEPPPAPSIVPAVEIPDDADPAEVALSVAERMDRAAKRLKRSAP